MDHGGAFVDITDWEIVGGFGTTGLWVYDGRFNYWWQVSGASADSYIYY